MLIGDLKQAFDSIVHDYSALNILNLLDYATEISNKRLNGARDDYRSLYTKLLNRLDEIEYESSFKELPDRIKSVIEDSYFTVLIPHRLSRYIRLSLDPDIEDVPPPAEFKLYKQMIRHRFSEITSSTATLSRLKFETYEPPQNHVSISIEFPRYNFNNDIGDLGSKLKKFDQLFSAISELVDSASNKPRLLSASTSDFFAILVAHADEAVAIMKYVAAFTGVVTSQIEMYATIKKMRAIGVDEKSLAPAEKAIDIAADKLVHKTLEEYFASFGDRNKDVRPEVKMTITNSTTFLIKNLSDGVKVEIERINKQQVELLAMSNFVTGDEEVKHIIQNQKKNQEKIDKEIQESDTPLMDYRRKSSDNVDD